MVSRNDIKLAEVHGKWRTRVILVWLLGAIGLVAASSLPIFATTGIFKALAGQKTELTMQIALGFTLALTVPSWVATAILGWKQRGQKKELERVRERKEKLERELVELKSKKGRSK